MTRYWHVPDECPECKTYYATRKRLEEEKMAAASASEIPNSLDQYQEGYAKGVKDGLLSNYHQLLFPPHPGNYYVCSALCTCGDYQYDCDTSNEVLLQQQEIRKDWFNNHLKKVI